MNGLSEDESSDSSNEFLVDPDEIRNMNSNFFERQLSKDDSIKPKTATVDYSTDDDECFHNENGETNQEIFTQVLQNLQSTRQCETNDEFTNRDIIAGDRKKSVAVSIAELLLLGESNRSGSGSGTVFRNVDVPEENDEEAGPSGEYTIPKDGVDITLLGTNPIFNNRKKKGKPDLKLLLRRKFKENMILIEKVGLLCWLAYGFKLNGLINEPEIMSTMLSLISSSKYPKNRVDLAYLEKFTSWFRKLFSFEETKNDVCISNETLLKALNEKKVSDYKELVLLYVATLRALGLNCRLVISLGPPHRGLNNDAVFEVVGKKQKSKSKGKTHKKKDKIVPDTKTSIPKNSSEAMNNAKLEAKKRAAEILHSKIVKIQADIVKTVRKTSKNSKETNTDSEEGTPPKKTLRTQRVSKADGKTSKHYKEESSDSEEENVQSKSVKTRASLKTDGKTSKYFKETNTDSEAEFQSKPSTSVKRKLKSNNPKTASTSSKKITKLLSTDSDNDESNNEKKTEDIWAEVYLESEENWICVSIMNEKIHCVADIYKKAKKPVLYVVAWNYEGRIRDVTRRYCPKWLTVTRKQRIDEKWWKETLSSWKEKDSAIARAEDELFLEKELEQPLPKTVGECKNHPLYVLARHLLKYEALYPPDCVPLGYTATKEAIYSRHCVHILRSRETWRRYARVVKPQQEPYKIVKALPKYDKLSRTKIKDLPLELFGAWQTTKYVPPEAKNGVVPRNEYGNVDLFQPCMIPKGTVHINLPALNRIARKLNIDCAPAVVGFSFGGISALPAFEGFVVCKEYEDTLREAWEEEQHIAAERAKEKHEKRVYGNWKRLIQGLIIRERLAAKYDFSEPEKTRTGKKTKIA